LGRGGGGWEVSDRRRESLVFYNSFFGSERQYYYYAETVLEKITASFVTVQSKGRQTKQGWKNHRKNMANYWKNWEKIKPSKWKGAFDYLKDKH
jgi:hypothetical protein